MWLETLTSRYDSPGGAFSSSTSEDDADDDLAWWRPSACEPRMDEILSESDWRRASVRPARARWRAAISWTLMATRSGRSDEDA